MSHRSLATCSIVLTGVLLAGCAQGTGGGESEDVTYDADADLSGSLSVMGFGADRMTASDQAIDEVAERADLANSVAACALIAHVKQAVVREANRDRVGPFAQAGSKRVAPRGGVHSVTAGCRVSAYAFSTAVRRRIRRDVS